mmetsp:Transcript_137761/g.239567  ORF Transcript_137761/g.239567 Transcript_137761/m.239567 type:complete len:132 (-) Transcript_137761:53-448(-)
MPGLRACTPAHLLLWPSSHRFQSLILQICGLLSLLPPMQGNSPSGPVPRPLPVSPTLFIPCRNCLCPEVGKVVNGKSLAGKIRQVNNQASSNSPTAMAEQHGAEAKQFLEEVFGAFIEDTFAPTNLYPASL